ncbi:MAG TPA: hypothetical protein RMH99_07650 [Sandaracinaceae bacterium LLY-WYZ-13_1]|nr:hypothetical protein [Sandaracinaceae bacterium LLY-WYZ-13_1]
MREWFRTALAASALMVAAGCDGEAPAPDAGGDAGADPVMDAGTDAGTEPDAGPECAGPPGLYAGGGCTELEVGVRRYETRYELWADGADKERFVYLPPDTTIDTSDPDQWVFPVGTRIYKTFLHEGVRLETRLLEKTDEGSGVGAWDMRAYAWNEAQDAVEDVTNMPLAVREDVLGTDHDIPSGADCVRCHGGLDVVNGFSAIMLNHGGAGVTLQTLLDESRLTEAMAPADAVMPGDETAAEALGYLHANCGHCHRENSGDPSAALTGLRMWVSVDATTVEETETHATSVGVESTYPDPSPDAICRIDPGVPDESVVLRRMESREMPAQMPPLATEDVDTEGVELVRAWIASVTGDASACTP